ncbi:hypothetical protein RV02_GL003481 [Enterococcus gilvus]|nr:hypothetical protein RV02_GL003481 [Enterococcus gilvus]
MYLFFFQKNKFDVHAVYHSTSFFILIFLTYCLDYFSLVTAKKWN